MANPLVVDPEAPKDEGILDQFDGAGIVSDVADTAKALKDGDEAGAALAGAGAALNALGLIEDPFKSLLSAGLGWAIEHFSFLREPLDFLAGDPGQIKAHAQTWQNVSKRLTEVADHREQGMAGFTSWQGDAKSRYQASATTQVQSLRETATSASTLSDQIVLNGVLVATERTLIRDVIANFVAGVAESLLAAAALAVPTAGGSLAAVVGKTVLEAVNLAQKLLRRVAQLLRKLSEAAEGLAKLAERVTGAAAKAGPMRSSAKELSSVAASVEKRAVGIPAKLTEAADRTLPENLKYAVDPAELGKRAAVESAKKGWEAENDRAEWRGETPPKHSGGWVPLSAGDRDDRVRDGG